MNLEEDKKGLRLGIVGKGSGIGIGDMLKSVYDIDNDGIVDNAEKLIGLLEFDDPGDLMPRGDTVRIEVDGNNDLMPGIGIDVKDKNFELDDNDDIQPKIT